MFSGITHADAIIEASKSYILICKMKSDSNSFISCEYQIVKVIFIIICKQCKTEMGFDDLL